MDGMLTPLLHLQPLPYGSTSRLLRRGCALALVVAVHVFALSRVTESSTPVLAPMLILTISRAKILRALLESIGYQIRDVFQTMEQDIGQPLKEISGRRRRNAQPVAATVSGQSVLAA